MKLSDFDYSLPKELIAQYPLKERDEARLLVIDRATRKIEHAIFKDLADYLQATDTLILNDTRVLPCRLTGRRSTGGKVDILLLSPKEGLTFDALIRPGRVKPGEKIIFNGGRISAQVSGRKEVTFQGCDRDEIYRHGVMPLPPYIKRDAREEDREDYQTVYAKNDGSIASPTAGLHFTRELLESIESRGVGVGFVTLHVGYSTFKPVACEDIVRHKMEPEYFNIPESTSSLIDRTKAKGGRVLAVGTTSMRSLEAGSSGKKEGLTDLFIYPGYEFKTVDGLLTNFHLPRTTLFMLTCAFAGIGLAKEAYREAVGKQYRFYSYGDAMLVL
jgi:S-adenosylmethionine:tRNA ribosyltransferase-isomerase